MSSIGDGNDKDDNDNNDSDGGGNLDDFLDPRKALSESDNLKRARAALSEISLPINFDDLEELEMDGQGNGQQDPSKTNGVANESGRDKDDKEDDASSQFTIHNTTILDIMDETGNLDKLAPTDAASLALANNDYLKVVAKLSPSDLISKFTATAHPRVRDAVRSTILGLIGTLPKQAFETTTITTGERLASLMYQLQMTGYMFKNAEYRLSLRQSLGMDSDNLGKYLLEDGQLDGNNEDDEQFSAGKVQGKIKVRYGKTFDESITLKSDSSRDKDEESDKDEENKDSSSSPSAMEVEVDAAVYMAEVRDDVSRLREDLTSTRQAKEEAICKDLLLYIGTLPQQELNTLTNTMSDDVLGAMKGLVNMVMGGIGEGQIDMNTVTEQSGEAMAQLCMWQLVVGYNLRELEVREEMKNAIIGDNKDEADKDEEGSIDYEEGGFQ